jgi:glycosyltransferase involved in cell wall biosynthesis
MKVAILYDCMFPYTVGGGERWYVNVAERLSEHHDVTYVTLRQWDADHTPDLPFKVVTVGPGMELYTEDGRRKILPPLRYGFGVFKYLLRHGGEYDIVHSSAFPYFSVIGAKAALLFHRRPKLVVDWLEVWSREYWRGYLGAIGGRIGFAIQQFCARLPDFSFAISQLHADRLPGPVTVNTGLSNELLAETRPDEPRPAPEPPIAVFAGRHIPEKNVVALPAAIAHARKTLPDLTMTIYGDGPERQRVIEEIERAGMTDAIDPAGFVDAEVVQEGMRAASCMVLPSIREGYGLVVIEALAQGTPAVVVAGPDNAAAEFIEPGVNGFVAASASAEQLGDAIVSAVRGGDELRRSSWRWYDENRDLLSIDDSIAKIEASYEQLVG